MVYRIGLQAGQIIAPTLATILYSFWGIYIVMFVDAITFLIMSGIALTYKFEDKKRTNIPSMGSSIKSGFLLFKDKEIMSLGVSGLISYLLVLLIFNVGLAFMVKNIFNASDQSYSFIQTVISIASILIAFTVPIINKKMNEVKALDLSMYGMLLSVGMLLLITNKNIFNYLLYNNFVMVIYFMIVTFIFYISFENYGVFFLTINQSKVEHKYLGRYNSLLLTLFAIGSAIGSPIFGYLFDTGKLIYPIMISLIGIVLKIVSSYFRKIKKIFFRMYS